MGESVKYRIGVGHKVADVGTPVIIPDPVLKFTADSTKIFADSTIRFADETL